jgi:uncharacterized membrane protein
MAENANHDGAVIAPGTLLGVGLGGFVDGILFHQILQWHNMLSSWVVPVDLVSMKVNMVWDGLFHAFTWLMTALGIALLWRAGRRGGFAPRATPMFIGSLSLGWGMFNFVEGLIDHQIIGIHHVHPGENQLPWDIGFLVSGLVFLALGYGLIRKGRAMVGPAR